MTKKFNYKSICIKLALLSLRVITFVQVVSWGNPNNTPMLLLHGYMDTAATFSILLDQLPDKYYYVGIDLPGHGKSDPLPPGIVVSKTHMVEAIRLVVADLKWERFVFMAHSIGCVIGLIYNEIFPNRISKMVLLDVGPALSWYYLLLNHLPFWYEMMYRKYYDNYERTNSSKPKLLTYDKAVSLVAVKRGFTKEQSDAVLSRSLVPMGNGTYNMSFEQRMKNITHILVSEDILYEIMTANMPPTLSIEASEPSGLAAGKPLIDNLFKTCEKNRSGFNRVTVIGDHNFHVTNPEAVATLVKDFLKNKSWYSKIVSKL